MMLYSVSKAYPRISESDLRIWRENQNIYKTYFVICKAVKTVTKTKVSQACHKPKTKSRNILSTNRGINIPVSLQYVNQMIHCLCANFHAIFLQKGNNFHKTNDILWPEDKVRKKESMKYILNSSTFQSCVTCTDPHVLMCRALPRKALIQT